MSWPFLDNEKLEDEILTRLDRNEWKEASKLYYEIEADFEKKPSFPEARIVSLGSFYHTAGQLETLGFLERKLEIKNVLARGTPVELTVVLLKRSGKLHGPRERTKEPSILERLFSPALAR
jgi:hypothetical protein